ncbi:septin 2 [Mortierella polycephala]|uniref:Septin 2 n=1 Tax=Mortierella polycephala TaxID=41804 RepID=A0A9P6PRB2_9FUNG|nr:septin 2 [Mortierella polycephala]
MDETSASAAALRIMLLGDIGVGKSAFIDTFASALSNIQENEAIEELISNPNTTATQTPAAIRLPGVHLRTAPVLQKDDQTSPFDDPMRLLPPKVDIPSRDLTFVTLPGYSSTINPSTILSMTDDYINHHLHTTTSIFSPAIPTAQLAWFLIAGSSAHSLPTCAFYFVLYELKPIDILYMKMIHERVNLIPIITKADTLSKNELWILKKRMLRQLKLNGIKIHTFGTDMKTIEQMTAKRQWGAPPFVVSSHYDSSGRLFESELEQLVHLCVYERIRHLQEDAAHKVIAWKKLTKYVDDATRKAFGPSNNQTKSHVEKVWSEKNAVKSSAGDSSFNNNTYMSHVDTNVKEDQVMKQASPVQYAPPPGQQQQQQQQQQAYPTMSQYPSQAPMPSNAPFTPPPSSANAALGNPVNFGLSTSYAPPPSFANGAASTFNGAPPLLNLNKPLPIQVGASSVNGLYSPPPSSIQTTPAAAYPAATTTYSPPPRSTSNHANLSTAQAGMNLMHNGTEMSLDRSMRPNVSMDDENTNIRAQIQGHESASESQVSIVDNYMTQPGTGTTDNAPVSPLADTVSRTSTNTDGNEVVKVEIPYSGTSYQPSHPETVPDNTQSPTAMMAQQGSFILPGGFQTPTAFLIPSMIGPGAGAHEYGEAIPDIWEAAELGDLATVQLHLNNGVSPDQRNNSRSTLLHRTAWQGVKPYGVMNLLISYGANVNLTNENGNTVLQNVLMKHDDSSLIKLLLDNGADASIPNKEGMNTLEVAALFNKLESARYLLENDLNSSDPQSIMNALQRARSPDKKTMKALLKGWQGKDGERRRFELMDRLRGHAPSHQPNDAVSIRSFETRGEGKSSKWLKLKF